MATVELSFTPLPAHVRTARLVATAVARRSGVEETLLDEVRLAVGEACSRAVEAHRLYCPAEPVRIELSNRDGRFAVVVTDAVPGGAGDAGDDRAMRAPHSTAGSAGTAGSAAHAAAPPAFPVASAEGGLVAEEAADRDVATAASGNPPLGGQASSDPPDGGPAATALAKGGGVNGRFPAGIGLAVITGLADDVQISATGDGVSIRMSWPLQDLN
jgi:serine/threonine-protein kinase RsbW